MSNFGPFDFSKPQTLDFCLGPNEPGIPEDARFTISWAAWVSDTGVRVGKAEEVDLPANNQGEKSSLYPTTKPSHLSLAFDRNALLAIAIQNTEKQIEIKWYTDNIGTTQVFRFTGFSPLLFCNWLTYYGPNNENTDVVCYYLKFHQPNTLFARFQHEGYAVEHVINDDLPVNLGYLIHTYESENQQVLMAKSDLGDNATLSSPTYGVFRLEETSLSIPLPSGTYNATAVNNTITPQDVFTLSPSVLGITKTFTKNYTDATPDKSTLSVSILGGNYS